MLAPMSGLLEEGLRLSSFEDWIAFHREDSRHSQVSRWKVNKAGPWRLCGPVCCSKFWLPRPTSASSINLYQLTFCSPGPTWGHMSLQRQKDVLASQFSRLSEVAMCEGIWVRSLMLDHHCTMGITQVLGTSLPPLEDSLE